MKPKFPVFVLFAVNDDDYGDWLLNNEHELATSLEWYDSDDNDPSMVIVDWDGNQVDVKVEACEIIRLEIQGQAQPAVRERAQHVRHRLKAA